MLEQTGNDRHIVEPAGSPSHGETTYVRNQSANGCSLFRKTNPSARLGVSRTPIILPKGLAVFSLY